MRENKILGISEEQVELVHDPIAPLDYDELAEYVQGMLAEMNTEQPELCRYSRDFGREIGIQDWLVYGTAVAASYKMIPESERAVRLSLDQINVFNESLREALHTGDESEQPGLWFVARLQDDSPAYMDWVADMIGHFDSKDTKFEFILGSAVSTMPFFMRAEAQDLERLFGEDN